MMVTIFSGCFPSTRHTRKVAKAGSNLEFLRPPSLYIHSPSIGEICSGVDPFEMNFEDALSPCSKTSKGSAGTQFHEGSRLPDEDLRGEHRQDWRAILRELSSS